MFFHFFKILIFWVDRGVKGQKAFQNDKKFCLSHSISQGPYIIWLSFMVQMCKMVISSGVFFSFKILIFRFVSWLKGQKINQNDKSFCLSHFIFQNHIKGQKMMENCLFQYVMLCISGTVDHIIEILLTISTGVFRYFLSQKYNIVNIKIILFFIGPLQQFF